MSATDPFTWNNVSAASKNTTRIGSVIRTSLCMRYPMKVTEDNSNRFAHLSAVLLTKNTPPASFELVNKVGELSGLHHLCHRQQSRGSADGRTDFDAGR